MASPLQVREVGRELVSQVTVWVATAEAQQVLADPRAISRAWARTPGAIRFPDVSVKS